MARIVSILIMAATAVFAGCAKKTEGTAVVPDSRITYSKSVKPFIEQHCISCHGGGMSYLYGGDLSHYDSLMVRVNKGVFKERLLMKKDMPPYPGPPISRSDSIMIQSWLNNAAPFE